MDHVYAALVTRAANQTASIRLRHQHLRDLIDLAADPARMSRQARARVKGRLPCAVWRRFSKSLSRLVLEHGELLHLFGAEMGPQGRKENVKEPGYAVRKVSTKRRHAAAPV
jgi:hypothetical protein